MVFVVRRGRKPGTEGTFPTFFSTYPASLPEGDFGLTYGARRHAIEGDPCSRTNPSVLYFGTHLERTLAITISAMLVRQRLLAGPVSESSGRATSFAAWRLASGVSLYKRR